MTYQEWEVQVPMQMRDDPLWKVEAYRLGLFLRDLSWPDATQLIKDKRTKGIADQLFRAAANISSNVTEGYSRGTSMERARFYEYALGSAREARDWYYKSRQVLAATVIDHRMKLTTSIIKLVTTTVANEHRAKRRIVPVNSSLNG